MKCCVLAWLLAAAQWACAREIPVSSAADIAREIKNAMAGDALVMKNGAWVDQAIDLKGASNVALRAQTPGQVILTGASSLRVEGEGLLVSGLRFDHATSSHPAIELFGSNCRLTETAIEGGSHKFFVRLHGLSNRVDHCYFAGKTNVDPTFQVEVEGRANFHRIDHNLFGHRPPLGKNGGETIRVGYSHQSMTNSGTLVELNVFDECDGELEIISSKSCENIYRQNAFLNCAGTLTLRHGNRCRVEGNYFDAGHKRGSGGIRIIGEDHVIANNYIGAVEMGAFWITSGIPNSELKGYFQARNILIVSNIVANSPGPLIQLDAGIGTSGRTLRPENIAIRDNFFALNKAPLLKGTEGANYKWENNLAEDLGLPNHAGISYQHLTPAPPKPPVTKAEVGPTWQKH